MIFTNATDAQLTNVEVINATNLIGALDLHLQSDGFIINTGNNPTTITGSAGADTITAGSSVDTINNFVGADTVNGGAGSDRLDLTTTSTDLNNATDAQLVNVEEIRLTSTDGITLNLGNQSEAFTISGSAGADTITATNQADTISGGFGDDTINAGGGNDIINGFGRASNIGVAEADSLDGGAGTDTLVLAGTASPIWPMPLMPSSPMWRSSMPQTSSAH
ncbi:MAG: hypothetical protein KF682_03000 [Nitrospira sp.]|nr:hypothetical protein [Nitrospira sp.]